MFGEIWRRHDIPLQNVKINNNKLILQVMPEEEELADDQIVMILKKRNPKTRLYETSEEFIFDAGKEPRL